MWALFWSMVCAGGLAAADYRTEIGNWRQKHEADIRSEKGPLLAVARQNVPEGRTTVGSDPKSDAVLPSRAPNRLGIVEREGDRIEFEPDPGATVTLNGKPLRGRTPLRTTLGKEGYDRLESGDFSLSVIQTAQSCQLVMRDRQSEFLKSFRGLQWFPPDEAYRIEAAFTAYPKPKETRVPDTTGGLRTMAAPGYATFRLHGKELKLEPVNSGDELFFMFKDGTSGKSTYGAGRFLSAKPATNGKVVLDFNQAYNPYCAYNPYISCPVVPKQNTLPIAIEAGEKYAPAH